MDDGGECRRALHFDLSTKRLIEEFGQKSYRNAWTRIAKFLESHGFEHAQYSGYESVEPMSNEKVFGIMQELSSEFPWFRTCAQAASITNIGVTHDVLGFLDDSTAESDPQSPPKNRPVSLKKEAENMRSASRAIENETRTQHSHEENRGDER